MDHQEHTLSKSLCCLLLLITSMDFVFSNNRTNWTPSISNSPNVVPSLPGVLVGNTVAASGFATDHATFFRFGMQVMFFVRFSFSVTWGVAPQFVNLNITLPRSSNLTRSSGDAIGAVIYSTDTGSGAFKPLEGLIESDPLAGQLKVALLQNRAPPAGPASYQVAILGAYEVRE